MEENLELREQIFEIINNQMDNNDPPETKITYLRLIAQGFDELETKKLIGQCLAVELFNILKKKEKFDNDRFVRNLKQLPKSPF